jgi:hypothetical protein
VRPDPGEDRGSVLPRRRKGAARHHRRASRLAADPPPHRRRCLDLQADQRRRGRHLARRRRRQLLRVRSRQRQPDLHARDPAHGHKRRRDLPHRLPRLVPGPYRSYPREGARQGTSRPHRTAFLLRHPDGSGLPQHPVQQAPEPHHAQRERLDLHQRRPSVDAGRQPPRSRRVPRQDHGGVHRS